MVPSGFWLFIHWPSIWACPVTRLLLVRELLIKRMLDDYRLRFILLWLWWNVEKYYFSMFIRLSASVSTVQSGIIIFFNVFIFFLSRFAIWVNVNVWHIYWVPLNPVTEALHAVELTLFLWHMPEGEAEHSSTWNVKLLLESERLSSLIKYNVFTYFQVFTYVFFNSFKDHIQLIWLKTFSLGVIFYMFHFCFF